MKQLTKIPITLVLVTCTTTIILLSLVSMSWASDVSRCEAKCKKQQPYFEEHLCMKECLAKEKEESHYHNMGGTDNGAPADAEEEYERCQETCHGTGMKLWHCQRTCQDEYETALERQRERGRHEREEEHERKHGHDHGKERQPHHDYSHCLDKCEDREEGFPRQRQCKLQCEEKFGRHTDHHRQGEGRKGYKNIIHTTNKKQETNNPFYFDSKSFESQYSTDEGHMKLLQRFSEKSDLLLGIDKFRVGCYEANPSSFMLPHHWDADSVLFVIEGKATMTFLKQQNRKTFNLKRGDVLTIPAGTVAYLISTHKDEKLKISGLLRPVNTPGQYKDFFGVGGEKSNSYFSSFSTEILQAALNLPRDQIDKLLKQQKKGTIVKASDEQMRRLTHGIQSKGPFNLLEERPQISNEHGKFYEVTPTEYNLLDDLDVSVAYCDIEQGSMMAPHYNSRTTYVVVVEEGTGYFEIAFPHSDDINIYEKVRSPLSKGDVFVIPAGHPATLVASENDNIRAIGFGINAKNNERNFLAGQDNIMNQLDEDAMELSFNLPAIEVEEMFQKQKQSYFMAGPQRRQQNAMLSFLDVAGI